MPQEISALFTKSIRVVQYEVTDSRLLECQVDFQCKGSVCNVHLVGLILRSSNGATGLA